MATLDSVVTNQYFTFKLREEIFAIEIVKVREVLEFTQITKVPQTPAMMKGVINLRGSVIPVIDLKLKFNMGEVENTINTCIVIIELELDGEKMMIGALVDAVKEVMDLDSIQIEPPPKIGTKLNTDFIKGMGKHEDQFIIILDIEKVFSTEEITLLQNEGDQ